MARWILLLLVVVFTSPAFAVERCREVFDDEQDINTLNHARPIEVLIGEAGLTSQWPVLNKSAARILHAQDFLRGFREEAPGFILGADSYKHAVKLFHSPMRLKSWGDGYREMWIHSRSMNHTANYLSAIEKTGRQVVFLVPPGIMSYPGITQAEMLWYLDQPSRLKNVTLVFGAYEVFTKGFLTRYNRTHRRDEFNQAIDQLKLQKSP